MQQSRELVVRRVTTRAHSYTHTRSSVHRARRKSSATTGVQPQMSCFSLSLDSVSLSFSLTRYSLGIVSISPSLSLSRSLSQFRYPSLFPIFRGRPPFVRFVTQIFLWPINIFMPGNCYSIYYPDENIPVGSLGNLLQKSIVEGCYTFFIFSSVIHLKRKKRFR